MRVVLPIVRLFMIDISEAFGGRGGLGVHGFQLERDVVCNEVYGHAE